MSEQDILSELMKENRQFFRTLFSSNSLAAKSFLSISSDFELRLLSKAMANESSGAVKIYV